MNLPEKTFLKYNCRLGESNFDCNRQLTPLCIMQFLQDAATAHAEQIGVGWDVMDQNGMLWVISKIKVEIFEPVLRNTSQIDLYTWPLAPVRAVAERCFVATDGTTPLFAATSYWTMISRDERKILPAETMNKFFVGEFSTVRSLDANFARVRLDESFRLAYSRTIRRSDLDKNGHVNNTYYVNFAMDVLAPSEELRGLEICYQRELKLGDVVDVLAKREDDAMLVVGQRNGETAFTAKLQLK